MSLSDSAIVTYAAILTRGVHRGWEEGGVVIRREGDRRTGGEGVGVQLGGFALRY